MTEMSLRAVNVMISWSFLLFFLILAGERMCSIAQIVKDKETKLTDSSFDIYVNFLTIIAVVLSLATLIIEGKSFWLSLFNGGVTVDYSIVICAAGMLLFAGMAHTKFTQTLTQFLAYGFLFAAMVLQTIVNIDTGADAFGCVYSLVYLIVFSMAVPVVYKSEKEHSKLFHIIEAVSSIVLVSCFAVLLRFMFIGRGENLLLWLPMIILAIYDTILVVMNRKDTKAYYLLSFELLTAAVFFAGKILMAFR